MLIGARRHAVKAIAAILVIPAAFSQTKIVVSSPPPTNRLLTPRTEARALDAPACPNTSGDFNSLSVPVNDSVDLVVHSPGAPAPPGGWTFEISSDDPTIVAAGNRYQGFSPQVFMPEGQEFSSVFTLYGNTVGKTNLEIRNLTTGSPPGQTPLGAWDVNPSSDFDFVDPNPPFVQNNPPANTCMNPGTANFSTVGDVLSTCGNNVTGVASDGVTQLLLRTAGGLEGTACYAITSTSSIDQGSIQDAVKTTEAVDDLQYGFTFYTAPKYYGDISNSRAVDITFTFTPSTGNGNTTTIQSSLTVVRPPVMLLHGVWSNGNGWNSNYLRNDQTHTTYAGDYQATNGSSFSVNEPYVQTAIQMVLANFRQKGFAAIQADVVAHSMGGLLTRLYAGSSGFHRPENLNLGDVHRLITLDTPHFGSSFANLVVALHQANGPKTESTVSELTGGSAVNGAVCDLAENSPGLQGLSGGTSLEAHVITATGGPPGTNANPAPYWGGATVFGVSSFESALTSQYCTNWQFDEDGEPICISYQYYFPQATVDGFRFRQMNDAVVALSSQQGALAGNNFADYIHFHVPAIPFVQRGVTDGSDVATQVFKILDGPDSGLEGALPAVQSNGTGAPLTVPGRGAGLDQSDYSNQCVSGGPMKPLLANQALTPLKALQVRANALSDARVNLASPAAGDTFVAGDTINIVVTLTPPLTKANTVGATLAGLKHVMATWTSGLSFSATFVVPPGITGPLTITPDFTDTSGNFFAGSPVVIGIKPSASPVSIALQQHFFLLPPDAPGQQLYLHGTYPDGSVFDVTSGLTGTSYATSDATVATVTADGAVLITGSGVASITVKNGGLTDFATLVVRDQNGLLPAHDVSSKFGIQTGGFRLDRNTGFFVQNVTINNLSAVPIPGPLYLVISGLPAGVSLVHPSGVTQHFHPGNSYLRLPLSSDGLTVSPAQSIPLTLQFLNPGRINISYSAYFAAVSLAP